MGWGLCVWGEWGHSTTVVSFMLGTCGSVYTAKFPPQTSRLLCFETFRVQLLLILIINLFPCKVLDLKINNTFNKFTQTSESVKHPEEEQAKVISVTCANTGPKYYSLQMKTTYKGHMTYKLERS